MVIITVIITETIANVYTRGRLHSEHKHTQYSQQLLGVDSMRMPTFQMRNWRQSVLGKLPRDGAGIGTQGIWHHTPSSLGECLPQLPGAHQGRVSGRRV